MPNDVEQDEHKQNEQKQNAANKPNINTQFEEDPVIKNRQLGQSPPSDVRRPVSSKLPPLEAKGPALKPTLNSH